MWGNPGHPWSMATPCMELDSQAQDMKELPGWLAVLVLCHVPHWPGWGHPCPWCCQ